jgi:hypothetical protein
MNNHPNIINDLQSQQLSFDHFFLALTIILSSMGGALIFTDLHECCDSLVHHPLFKIIILFSILYTMMPNIQILVPVLLVFIIFYNSFIIRDFSGVCDDKAYKKLNGKVTETTKIFSKV